MMSISSLFSRFGMQQPSMNNGFNDMLNRFKEFKRTFSGNPQQQVQQLLNSGQMTQEQFNQLSKMATQFQNMMRGK